MKIDIHETEAVAERSRSAAGMRAADETLAPTGARPTAADRVRTALLEQFMPSLGVVRRSLHLGCAETALLLAIGECAASVRAVDADDSHIARAREGAAAAGLNRVQFVCGAMGGDLPEGEFDLISLSHVLSGSADEQALARQLAMLVARLVPHGHLVTQDWIGGQAAAESLRSQEAWRHALSDAGLRCVCAQQIESDAEGAVHWLMLWRRPAAPTDTVSAEVPVAEVAGQGGVPAVRNGGEPSESATLIAQQERQSEVLLQIGQMVLALGQQMQAIESRLTSAAGMQPVIERIDRIESTLHWLARQPRAAVHGPVRVAFLIHHAAAWPALRGIVDAMRGAADFEPVVVSLPHCFPMLGKLGGEDDVHAMLTAQGYAHVRVPDAKADQALERVKMLNPQVIFRQAPWDADVPPGLQAQHLAFAKLCYVPYGYLTARIEQQQFDQLYHRLCWRIFCPDEAHRALFATHNLQAGSNCRVTGYPKFDHLLQGAGAAGAGADWPVSSPEPLAYRLIWAPHFSYEGSWLRFGVFDRMAEAMLRFVAGHRDVEVVAAAAPGHARGHGQGRCGHPARTGAGALERAAQHWLVHRAGLRGPVRRLARAAHRRAELLLGVSAVRQTAGVHRAGGPQRLQRGRRAAAGGYVPL